MVKAVSLRVSSVDCKKVVVGLLALAAFCAVMVYADGAFADTFKTDNISDTLSGTREFPWTKMLNTLAQQLTGPLPLTLGILGLAAAAIAMFTGNGGGGTQKFIMLIFAVSTCLFAPTFISWIRSSAGAATMSDVVVVGDAVVEGVKAGALLP